MLFWWSLQDIFGWNVGGGRRGGDPEMRFSLPPGGGGGGGRARWASPDKFSSKNFLAGQEVHSFISSLETVHIYCTACASGQFLIGRSRKTKLREMRELWCPLWERIFPNERKGYIMRSLNMVYFH